MNFNIASVSKAIAGAIGAVLVSYLAKHNYVVDGDLKNAIDVILTAVIGFVVVWIAPKNKV